MYVRLCIKKRTILISIKTENSGPDISACCKQQKLQQHIIYIHVMRYFNKYLKGSWNILIMFDASDTKFVFFCFY